MDELWQRYRTFWTPILWGVGVFLAGLVVVHVLTDDPAAGAGQNASLSSAIKQRSAPTPAQIASVKANVDGREGDAARPGLAKRAQEWAQRIDQRHGEEEDVLRAAVKQSLDAAILRSAAPGDASAFEGDPVAAAQARSRRDQLLEERLTLLRTLDPNVGFSRLQADVVSELAVRANRADVDLGAEDFGLSAITSVDRADLPRRLLNLALIAQVVDVAIRAGVRSIDAVSLLSPDVQLQVQGADAFLSEWPLQVDLTGDPRSLKAVLTMLTDPARPTALGTSSWKHSGKKDGLVKAQMKVYSVRSSPAAPLNLEAEAE
jgi:hypothetical protein